MEDKTKKVVAEAESITTNNEITRKEALLKAGKFAAFTALGMMVMLSPKKSQAGSGSPAAPGFGGPSW